MSVLGLIDILPVYFVTRDLDHHMGLFAQCGPLEEMPCQTKADSLGPLKHGKGLA